MTWILSILGIASLWLMGNKSLWGIYVGLLCQICWFYYVFDTNQLGLLPGVIVYTVVYLRNGLLWRKG